MRPAVGGLTSTDRRFAVVARAIADEIRAGALGDAGYLPSERALVTRFGVSRVTVRRALRELEADGLFVSAAGRDRELLGLLQRRFAHTGSEHPRGRAQAAR